MWKMPHPSEKGKKLAVDQQQRRAVALRLADEAQRVEHLRVAIARGKPGLCVVTARGHLECALEPQRSAEIVRGAGNAAIGRAREPRLQIAERRLRRARHRGVAPADLTPR